MMMKENVSAENFQIKWLMNTNINFKTKKKQIIIGSPTIHYNHK